MTLQIAENNAKSFGLLLAFPGMIFAMLFLYFRFTGVDAVASLVRFAPMVIFGIMVWFLFAFFMQNRMISRAVGSREVTRKENRRFFEIVEGLAKKAGMKMPKLHVIDDGSLNAFASGTTEKSFAVTVSRGLLAKLSDDEIAAVIGHELTHIRNRDVRLLIISIIFVGVFSFVSQMIFQRMIWGGVGRDNSNVKVPAILIALGLAVVGYIFALATRFALSRAREFLADAGSAELTGNPRALIVALRKISVDPTIESVRREDVAQLFIEHPSKKVGFFAKVFATHPPIAERIAELEKMT